MSAASSVGHHVGHKIAMKLMHERDRIVERLIDGPKPRSDLRDAVRRARKEPRADDSNTRR